MQKNIHMERLQCPNLILGRSLGEHSWARGIGELLIQGQSSKNDTLVQEFLAQRPSMAPYRLCDNFQILPHVI